MASNFKRLLAGLMVVSLLLTLLPLNVFAAEESSLTEEVCSETEEVGSETEEVGSETEEICPETGEACPEQISSEAPSAETAQRQSVQERSKKTGSGGACGGTGCSVGTFQSRNACVNENGELHICEANFPDSLFREYLCNKSRDKDSNGAFSESEISAIKALTAVQSAIADFTGIAFLSSLTSVNLRYNTAVQVLDLTENSALTSINVSGCSALTSLDISGLTNLTSAGAANTPALSQVNAADCTSLMTYDGENTGLTTANFAGCEALESLKISNINAARLSEMSITGCKALKTVRIGYALFTSLDFSEAEALTSLTVRGCRSLTELNLEGNNDLTSLDISNSNALTSVTDLHLEKKPGLKTLECVNCTGLTGTLDLTENNVLETVNIQKCYNLTTLVLGQQPKLKTLTMPTCDALQAPDFSGCTALESLDMTSFRGSSVDLGPRSNDPEDVICPNLVTLTLTGSKLTSLDVSNHKKLTRINFSGNNSGKQLASLDVTGCTALKYLNCSTQRLTALDVSSCTALETLICNTQAEASSSTAYTALKSLVLPVVPEGETSPLTTLTCNTNKGLTNKSLNLRPYRNLTTVNCREMALTELLLPQTSKLTSLTCDTNQIKYLDVSACTNLKTLICNANNLRALDLSQNAALSAATVSPQNPTELSGYKYFQDGNDIYTLNFARLYDETPFSGSEYENISSVTNGTYYPQTGFSRQTSTTGSVTYEYDTNPGVPSSPKMQVPLSVTFNARTPNTVETSKTEPTCTAEGLYKYEVTDADTFEVIDSIFEIIPPLGHSSSGATAVNNDDGTHTYRCSREDCDCYVESEPHNYAYNEGCCFCGAKAVPIDEQTFPDEIFQNYVMSYLDTNKDGFLSETERSITSLNVSGMKIADLTGISVFTALTELNCSNNALKSLDLTQCTELAVLNCASNKLKELTSAELPASLQTLDCSANTLTQLQLSHITGLLSLNASNNCLLRLDLSANNALSQMSLSPQKPKNTIYARADSCAGPEFTVSLSDILSPAELDRVNGNTVCVLTERTTLTYSYDVQQSDAIMEVTLQPEYPAHHPANGIKENYVEATCTVAGSYDLIVACSICEQTISSTKKTIPALGHSVAEWSLTTQPSCLTAGIQSGACLRCGNTVTKEVLATGHRPDTNSTPAQKTPADDQYHSRTCASCGKQYDEAHSFAEVNGVSRCACGATALPINSTTFPDSSFRSYVLTVIDTNKDAYLVSSEALAVTSMSVVGLGISDLTGIAYFTELTELNVSSNMLTELCTEDIPSVEILCCSSNRLETLDTSPLKALTELDCSSNALQNLTLNANTALTTLNCRDNCLEALDLRENLNLTTVDCTGNLLTAGALQLRNMSGIEQLRCGENPLTVLDVSNQLWLEFLGCSGCNLRELDLSKNLHLTGGIISTQMLPDDEATVYKLGEIGYVLKLTDAVPDVTDRIVSVLGAEFDSETGYALFSEAPQRTVTYRISTGAAPVSLKTMSVTIPVTVDENAYPTCRVETTVVDADCTTEGVVETTVYAAEDSAEVVYVGRISSPALGHDWDDGVVVEAQTCVSGAKLYTCTRDGCGETKREDVPGGHKWNAGTVTTEASCLTSTPGVLTRTCTICGAVSTEEIPYTHSPAGTPEYLDENYHLCTCACGTTYKEAHTDYGSGCSCGVSFILVNEANFPDANFRYWVAAHCDTAPQDGKLSARECAAVREINVKNYDISSLEGIQYFTALLKLTCSENTITHLDLSANTALQILDCSNNILESLNVTGCSSITELQCYNNRLTSLSVTGCENLSKLICRNNQLQTLALGQHGKLNELDCRTNQLQTLFLSGCPKLATLKCSDNLLKELDIAHCSNLTVLICNNNRIPALNLNAYSCLDYNGIVSPQTPQSLPMYRYSENEATRYTLDLGVLVGAENVSNITQVLGAQYDAQTGFAMFDAPVSSVTYIYNTNSLAEDIRTFNATLSTTVEEHNAAEPVTENVTQASCTQDGAHDVVTYCSDCGAELYRIQITDEPATGHVLSAECEYQDSNYHTCLCAACGEQVQQLHNFVNAQCTDCVASYIPINELYFPDRNFRRMLLESYDPDGDGFFSAPEIALITEMDVEGAGLESINSIESLQGIGYFTALEELNCSDNRLRTLDVSGCTALRELNCETNLLTDLDVTDNPALEVLKCVGNSDIHTLDLTECPKLKYLDAQNADLTSLDVSRNPELVYLNCSNDSGGELVGGLDLSHNPLLQELYCRNLSLTELDISSNPALRVLDCSRNSLETISVSDKEKLEVLICSYNRLTDIRTENNAALIELNCQNNLISELDLTKNTKLENLSCSNNIGITDLSLKTNKELTVLNCENCRLTALNTAYNPELQKLNCTNNPGLKTLDVSSNTMLKTLKCGKTGLTSLDVLRCPDLVTLQCDNCRLTELFVSDRGKLTSLQCQNNLLETLDISGCSTLTSLNCTNNPLLALNAEGCKKLETISWSGASLQSLILTDCVKLTEIDCSGNDLAELIVANCILLRTINCSDNELTELDVSTCAALQSLDCSGNHFEVLNIAGKTGLLEYLDCSGNELKSLDVSGCVYMQALDCSGNELESLSVSGTTNINSIDCSDNALTSLNLSGHYFLAQIICSNNSLNELNVSDCPGLLTLDCENNLLPELNIEDSSALSVLWCGNNRLPTLELGTVSNTLNLGGVSEQNIGYVNINVNENGEYTVDLREVVGEEYLDRIISVEGATSVTDGIAVFSEKLNQITYLYDTADASDILSQMIVHFIPKFEYSVTATHDGTVTLAGDITVSDENGQICSGFYGGQTVYINVPVKDNTAITSWTFETADGVIDIPMTNDGSCFTFVMPDQDVNVVFHPEKIAIKSAYLLINENINLTFSATVPESFTNPYMVIEFCGSEYELRDYTVGSDGKLCFEFTYTRPQLMCEAITATLYATAEERECISVIKDYSVKKYCSNLLGKTTDPLLITLLSDILAYGEASQRYINWKTDELATDGVSNYNPSIYPGISNQTIRFEGEGNSDTFWNSATLALSNNIGIKFIFTAADISALRVRVSLDGRSMDFTDFTDEGNGRYSVTLWNIYATEFGATVSAQFFRGEEQIGNTVKYSVNTYISSMQNVNNETLKTLLQTIYNYGSSALIYYKERILGK